MIYLDNAATTYPKPPEVIKAVLHTMKHIGANPGRSGHRMSIEAGRVIMNARSALADFFHAQNPMRFVFGSNCTEALNTAILGSYRLGGHIITTALEHNSVLRPVHELSHLQNIKFTILEPNESGAVSAQQVEQAIQPNTCLVCINHVSNVTGAIQPIEAIANICRQNNLLILVDAAQSAGVMPIDLSVLPIDLLAFPGHKGLYGPQGTGALYIRESLSLKPLKYGGTGTQSFLLKQPVDMPEHFESGTLNTPGLAGLLAGIQFVQSHFSEIALKEHELATYLINELKNINGVNVYTPMQEKQTGVVSFNVGLLPSDEVADLLDQAHIACRAGIHCAPLAHQYLGTVQQGAVRFSLSYYNTKHDLDTALSKISKLARTLSYG